MDSDKIACGISTLKQMNSEIEANTAAIAALQKQQGKTPSAPKPSTERNKKARAARRR